MLCVGVCTYLWCKHDWGTRTVHAVSRTRSSALLVIIDVYRLLREYRSICIQRFAVRAGSTVDRNSHLLLILSQLNPVRTVTSYFFNIHFCNTVPVYLTLVALQILWLKFFLCVLHLPCVVCDPLQLIVLDLMMLIGLILWKVQIMEGFIMQFSRAPCCFLLCKACV